ncbi:MAG: hypothetical protein ACRC2T_12695 [Thermoguttaceae bacterium]
MRKKVCNMAYDIKDRIIAQLHCEELAELLEQQEHLYVDDTKFKNNGKMLCAWCFVT